MSMKRNLIAGILPEYHIEKIFLFSLMWSLGAVLELDERNLLQEFLVNHQSKCNWPKYKVILYAWNRLI